MKPQGTVKGILIEGSDGHEYLLGFRPTQPVPTPTLSRRQADGSFKRLDDLQEASKVAWAQVGMTPSHLIGPGMGRTFMRWSAFQEALKSFPSVPRWPTWPS